MAAAAVTSTPSVETLAVAAVVTLPESVEVIEVYHKNNNNNNSNHRYRHITSSNRNNVQRGRWRV